MLKNIHPLLNADLLQVLRAMGHGDELVICDCNFPADAVASTTVVASPLRLDGVGTTAAGEAILSVLPLDSFVDHPVYRMEVVGDPLAVPEVQQEFKQVVDQSAGRAIALSSIERHAFYDRARQAYAVVATSERRGYGCFILVKGVIGEDGEVVW